MDTRELFERVDDLLAITELRYQLSLARDEELEDEIRRISAYGLRPRLQIVSGSGRPRRVGYGRPEPANSHRPLF